MGIEPLGAGLPPLKGPDSFATKKAADFAVQMEQAAAKAQTAQAKGKTVPAGSTGTVPEDPKLRDACRGMEAVFLNLMLSRMRATVPKSNLLGQSSQEEIMRSMLDTEMTKNMAQAGGIGLADMLYRQLSLQATATKATNTPKSQLTATEG